MVKVNGAEYHEDRILYTPPSVVGKLFDAPSVGNARSRTLTLNLMPYDGPQGHIPPMSEILLFVRLKSADGQRVSEWIPKGAFYADEVKRDTSTGMLTISAFDAMMKMERAMGNAVVRIVFDDGFGGIQRYVREIGDAMPTPDTPAHEGERFVEWYPDPADTPTLERDMLFVAQWVQKFTVIFDDGTETPQTFSCFKGDTTPMPTVPTKDGYTFTGWTPTPAATVTADATYTAQWEQVTLQSVAITSQPTKTAYFVGDTLDYAGLVVTASYSDGTTADVTADCVISPAAGTEVTEAGTITVTVSYNGETVGTFGLTAGTVDVIASGDWWTLYSNGLLDVYCDGDMPDYDFGDSSYDPDYAQEYGPSPWDEYCSRITNVTIRDSVTHIGYSAFAKCSSLSDVTIGNGVTEIGNNAFGLSGLENIVIPGNVASIDAYAFAQSALRNVTIQNGVTYIGDYAFWQTDLTEVTIPASVTDIGDGTFSGCTSLTGVTIPNSVTYIGSDAFMDCTGLTSVTIPNGVTDIGDGTFSGCTSLTGVTIPNSVTYIGSDAFMDCTSLTSITIPNSVTSIGDSSPDDNRYNRTFQGCSNLESVTLSNRLEAIPYGTFLDCTSLKSIAIPTSVTHIYDYAFSGCTSLTSVYYSGTQTQWNAITIETGNSALTNATIHYESAGPT